MIERTRSVLTPEALDYTIDRALGADMKPRSKSVWITPAACGAVAPTETVQARMVALQILIQPITSRYL